MQLIRARITHFRSLRDVTVYFGPHTALIGGNGAGKSSILKALERFYSTSKGLDQDDFFNRDQSIPVEIELTYGFLNESENEVFASRVRSGLLVVTRVFDQTSKTGSYYGVVPQNRDFIPIRTAISASSKKEAYRDLRSSNPYYSELPAAASAVAVDTALDQWEASNPQALSLERDDGQFFGFQNASRGALQRHTSFVFIPAVREAATDAADSKASPIGRLLEILVRSSILKRAEVLSFQHDITARYKQIVSPENMPELRHLADGLTKDLKELYGNAAVGLEWRETGEIPIPLPAADVTLSDDGFGGPVDRQGHGLQRAFVFTLLQHLARASAPTDAPNSDEDKDTAMNAAPNLILAVEEPELYQHPTKQRHLSQVLRNLSQRALPGASSTTQVIFASHSPMFISLTNADEIRLVRRSPCEDVALKQCAVRALDLTEVAKKLEKSNGKPIGTYSAETLKPRLHILGTDLSEGFFADGIVLVEGRSDKAALFATARMLEGDFESAGIAVLAVEGKNNLDRPYLIFRELGIPVYMIWDCDCRTKDHKPQVNLALNRLVRSQENLTAPLETTFIGADHSHFEVSLEMTIKNALTEEVYDTSLRSACAPYGFDPSSDAQKIPDVMHGLLRNANEVGKSCEDLNDIVNAIWLHLKGSRLTDMR